MNRVTKSRSSERDLGQQSKQLAEDERELVAPDRLAQTITEFVEWRAFSYWLRLTVETQGFVSDPELARIGLSETEAEAQGIAYRLFKVPMETNLRARTLSETRGFVKALVEGD